MATWSTPDTQYSGVITRRLSDFSFETDNPALCAEWLRALEYVDVPRRWPGEHARLQLGIGTAIVYDSGLVICLPGVRV
jgi:hypothetical protein